MIRDCSAATWFEDYSIGDEFHAEDLSFSEDEIIAFATRYDPQPFHIDREAAQRSQYGGIIASGTQLFAAIWGKVIGSGFMNSNSMGSFGLDMRYHRPIYANDILSISTHVRGKRPSNSRSDRGYIDIETIATNQDGKIVTTLRCEQIIPTSPD